MSRSIEWRHDRRRIVLPVTILRATPSTDLQGVEGRALIDTGSTTTGITPRIANALGLPKRGKRPIGSAQGQGQAERYLFRIGLHPEGEDGSPQFPFVFDDVVGFELTDSFQFEALIGMDILSQCSFGFDQSGKCTLRFG